MILVLPSALCPHLAAVLPGGHRQGARASQPEHARRTDDRAGGNCAIRGHSRHTPHVSVCPYHEPDRCRVGSPPISSHDGAANRLFPGAARRRLVARVRELENIRQFLTSSALTLVIDLLFTFVFLAVMFYYSLLLTFAVLGAFPFYIAISAGATPLFRKRLDEKFRRGAENQAFLVESVTGVETLKASRSSHRCSAAGRSSSLVT